MTSPQPLLSVRDVRTVYGDVVALDGVSFDILENEFFALLGPSGSGKTTLLRSIAGFETPTAGEIDLDGKNLLSVPAHKRPINLMFQSYALFPHMSVAKNVAYGLEAERLPKDEIASRVDDILATVGLSHLASRRTSALSGGQRQRVALARALVKRPRLLLLDEPLSALDRKVRAEMQSELKRLQHEVGMTFVVVTHDQEEAMSMADRVAVLEDGRLEQLDTPVGLYSKPRTRFVAAFIGTANLLEGRATAGGIDVPGIGELRAEHELAPGDAATAVIRPEDVTVTREPAALAGTVVDIFFLGGSTTVSVAVDGLADPVRCTVHAAVGLARGDVVGVSIAPERIVVVPAAGPTSPAALQEVSG